MSIERLVKEFGAQDVGAHMVVRVGLKPMKVAAWVNGANVWAITPEGEALLAPPEAPVVESVNTSTSDEKPKRGRKVKEDEEFDI